VDRDHGPKGSQFKTSPRSEAGAGRVMEGERLRKRPPDGKENRENLTAKEENGIRRKILEKNPRAL